MTDYTTLLEKVADYPKNPKGFISDVLNRKLSDKQAFFIDCTKTKKHIVAIWSRQTGKSTVIASYIVHRGLYGTGMDINGEHIPEHIAVVAPIRDQVINLYEKIEQLIHRSELISNFVIKSSIFKIKFRNGNEIKFFSASPGSQIRGYTATCIVIDESQDITDSKYAGDVLPFGATTNALIIEAGTPKTKNHFYNAMKSSAIEVIKQPWFECPFLSEEYVMAQKAISVDSLWRQEYMCEFVEEGVMAFPSRLFEPETLLGEVTGKWNLGDYKYVTKVEQVNSKLAYKIAELVKEGATFTAGIDVGKINDNTVYTIVRTDQRPVRLALQIEWPLGTNYSEIAKLIGLCSRIYQIGETNLDYTNEKGFLERLQENDVAISSDTAKIKSMGPIVFTSKNKAEMVSAAVLLLENFSLQLPRTAEKLISQFLNQQYEITGNDMYKYYHPTNEHDDMLWSTLLALKNIKLYEFKDTIAQANSWEKYDEIIHPEKQNTVSEILASNQLMRNKNITGNRYQVATGRRNKVGRGWI